MSHENRRQLVKIFVLPSSLLSMLALSFLLSFMLLLLFVFMEGVL